MLGNKVWDKLSADERKIFRDAFIKDRDYQRAVSREEDAKHVADRKAQGSRAAAHRVEFEFRIALRRQEATS
jgi:TRAP-type C4-dicarboxylate transport system substrate-binding protein